MRSLSQYHIEAHHILRYAKMWCALCTHLPYLPRTQAKGDILSCHWLDIIAPQYRSALSLQEAANIAGTPPQVCGRSWESIIIPDVCHRINRANGWSNGCIYRSDCAMHCHHGAAHYVALPFGHIGIRTQNTVYVIVKEQNCMTLNSSY